MKFQLTIGKKLAISVAAFVVCLAALGVTSLKVISTLGNSLDSAVNIMGKKLELVDETREAFQDLKTTSQRSQVAYAIGELERHAPAAAQGTCTACHTPASVAEDVRAIETSSAKVRKSSDELRRFSLDDTERKPLDTLNAAASRWVDDSKEYLRLANSNRFDDAHAVLRDKIAPLLEDAEKATRVLASSEREALTASNSQARSTISLSRWAVFMVVGINLLVAVIVLWVVFRITAALREVAAEIGEGAEQVAAAAEQVSSSSQTLAQGASEQAASLEETSASSQQINSMAHGNTENLRSAAGLVTQSQQQFTLTERALGLMVAWMSEMNASSGKISGIIKMIDEIAFQTNILALNAAVEAARAGEAGMGFSVVAGEVRNLAKRSAQAAKDTANLIEESMARSGQGKAALDQVAAAVRSTSEIAGRIKELVDKVKLGSEEQAQGSGQVAKAIAEMDQVTQTTAANAEQSASAAEELNAHSEALHDIVVRLTSMVGQQAGQ